MVGITRSFLNDIENGYIINKGKPHPDGVFGKSHVSCDISNIPRQINILDGHPNKTWKHDFLMHPNAQGCIDIADCR